MDIIGAFGAMGAVASIMVIVACALSEPILVSALGARRAERAGRTDTARHAGAGAGTEDRIRGEPGTPRIAVCRVIRR